MTRKRIYPFCFASVLFLLSACQDRPTPSSSELPSTAVRASSVRAEGDRFRPGEEQSAELARVIPGFGGYFLDPSGNLHAFLIDMKNEGQARAALAHIIPETRRDLSPRERRRFSSAPQIILHQGGYEFTQLADWRNKITEVILRVPGVSYNGLDQHTNRLAIGVERKRSAAARRAAEQTIDGLGVPRGAIKFEDTDLAWLDVPCDRATVDCEPPPPSDPCTTDPSSCDPCTTDPSSCETPAPDPCVSDPSLCVDPGTIYPADSAYSYIAPPDQYLYSKFSKIFGGIQVSNPAAGATGAACTIGFVAKYRGLNVFITNSHCSATRGARDYPGSMFYQPDWNSPQVGQEIVDNGKMSSGRYVSDVSVVQLQNVPGQFGYIARTWDQRGGLNGIASTRVYSPNPYLKIIAEVSPRQDYEFHKIGRSTGWTYGYARKVCYDTALMRCVTWVAAGTDHGDSGSPVFRYYDTGVGIAGIVYAKADGGFWMTPMSQIRLELNATGTAAGDLRIY